MLIVFTLGAESTMPFLLNQLFINQLSAWEKSDSFTKFQNIRNLDRVVEKVYEAAATFQIMSPQFTACLSSFCAELLPYVDHFAELLFEFAASTQDLVIFDQNSEYIR